MGSLTRVFFFHNLPTRYVRLSLVKPRPHEQCLLGRFFLLWRQRWRNCGKSFVEGFPVVYRSNEALPVGWPKIPAKSHDFLNLLFYEATFYTISSYSDFSFSYLRTLQWWHTMQVSSCVSCDPCCRTALDHLQAFPAQPPCLFVHNHKNVRQAFPAKRKNPPGKQCSCGRGLSHMTF